MHFRWLLSGLTISFRLVWIDKLLLEVDRVLSVLDEFIFINILSDICGLNSVIFSSNFLFLFRYIDPSISIILKSFVLFILPDLNEALDCLKGELLLFDGQLTVLSNRVEADDILLLLGPEWIEFDSWPFHLLRDKLFTVSFSLLLCLGLLLLPLLNLFFLSLLLL